MTHVLVLGATGRAGSATLAHLSTGTEITAALRSPGDSSRLPSTTGTVRHLVVDINDATSLCQAIRSVDVIVNAVRLREDIPATALSDLHQRLLHAASQAAITPLVVTIGGAGSMLLPNGTRFWQHPAFPARTLPRGRAHAHLRHYLESGQAGNRWAYLIPPPAFLPDGPDTGSFTQHPPSTDESTFTRHTISYTDYARAVAHAAEQGWTGTHLIA